jgi:hypothetical protein
MLGVLENDIVGDGRRIRLEHDRWDIGRHS